MTHPKGTKFQPKLKLDMPFAEALQRFSLVEPKDFPRRRGGTKHKRRRSKAHPSDKRVTDSGDTN
jgi:hypothetical protein